MANPNTEDKFKNFLKDLKELCVKHDVKLSAPRCTGFLGETKFDYIGVNQRNTNDEIRTVDGSIALDK